jgi:hypothetical protein
MCARRTARPVAGFEGFAWMLGICSRATPDTMMAATIGAWAQVYTSTRGYMSVIEALPV